MSVSNHDDFIRKVAEENQFTCEEIVPLTGGDINEVFLIKNASDKYVIKINSARRFPGMFEAEKFGLETLKKANQIDIPKPITTGTHSDLAYLILEHKDSAPKSSDFWSIFGEQLAKLHKVSSEEFGLEKDNFIGSLPQYNTKKQTASEFYIEMRLKPQIELAEEKGYQLNAGTRFFSNCRSLIPDEKPSLIHGDLWNGNFIINTKGMPCLIDPAVAYAPREMDLGMMKLFGSFDSKLFDTYNEVYPLEPGWKERLDLWQLYYLLVHLNIFGAGYKAQVTSIINKYH